jgi:hypothetical protein
MCTMVSTFKLNNPFSLCKSAGKSDSMHCGFRASIDKTHHFSAWHNLTYHFRKLDLAFCRHAKERPIIELGSHSFNHRRIAMTKNHGSIAHTVVKVYLIVCSSELASKCRGRKERIRLVKAHWTVNPAGQDVFCLGKELIRFQA